MNAIDAGLEQHGIRPCFLHGQPGPRLPGIVSIQKCFDGRTERVSDNRNPWRLVATSCLR